MKVITLILTIFLVACSPREIREAKHTVILADSLWHAGTPCDDSASLAQAYETLGALPFPFREVLGVGSAYSHACYHYGRLLRQKENPVEAMQVFISATHSHTRDYHILGRIYSNMGDICHLAGDYQLSYDMFECSAEKFMQDKDTVSYYYAINSMAFELAEQEKKDEAYSLLATIENLNTNPSIIPLSLYTKALTCNKAQQYDSTIYYTSLLLSRGYHEPDLLLTRAQAYSYLGKKDSAVYYAKLILENSNKLFHRCNALYILTNDDKSEGITSIREIAKERADTQRLVEIRQGKLTQATQLLEQDLNRKPNLNWLYAIIATLLIIGIGIVAYVKNRRKKNQLLKQEFDSLNQATEEIKEKHNALNAQYNTNYQRVEEEIYHTCDMMRSSNNITKDLSWNNYENMCKIIDKNLYMFVTKLHHKKDLKETETRLCILVLIGYSRPQIAQILPYASNSVGKLKDQTAKSLGTTGKNLRDFLLKTAIEG